MIDKKTFSRIGMILGGFAFALLTLSVTSAYAVCPPGEVEAFPGSDTCILDPLSIPKYVIPLVIPPVMNNDGVAENYDIAVRQFDQQILPGGIWNTLNGRADAFPATTVWSYGPAADAVPAVAAPDPLSQFNYPAYTIESTSNTTVNVQWINDLVDAGGNYLPHLLGPVVDQTLHWANPGLAPCAHGGPLKTKDCTTLDPTPYTGPVPIVTHVHGAHVDPHSDGYPEAWWLPAAANIPAGYDTEGTLFTDANGQLPSNSGFADYSYINTQPATTLWYHDHTLGMTRLNVYAGPAGFWLVRGGAHDSVDDGTTPALNDGILPGPAPVAGQGVLELNVPTDPVRQSIREIPIVVQDRSFNGNGSLYYPDNRAFFEGLNVAPGGTPPILDIPFVPGSDIAPIWNPEAFFSTMVVNGVTWPTLEVAPAIYRLRLLNGCNSRFLNLALFRVNKQGKKNKEFPMIQIGAEQGFLPQAVELKTGKATLLPGDGLMPMMRTKGTFKDQAVLMGLAERADVLVDFRGLKNGTVIQMTNTAPDAPFGGFPDIPADPATTGQVMQFVVNSALLGQSPTDPVLADGVTPNPNAATNPYSVIPNSEPANTAVIAATQNLSLNEEESLTLCVDVDLAGNVIEVPGQVPPCILPAVPMAPKAALLGELQCVDAVTGLPAVPPTAPPACLPTEVLAGVPLLWSEPMTERPIKDDTELWEVYNLTVDGHPIHLHLVRFQVVDRQALDPITNLPVPGTIRPPEPWETGYKDTVISYPGEVTRLKATFDIAGLYVWHCHIVEHEDNEMMRPYCVDAAVGVDSCPLVP